ncbi:MAG: aminopeptidase P family protein [Bacteroidales bacterium]|nr:aminopeptidase P family protein [Bacteroidales bacterium]HOY39755.1 aminopeptidase P family protein [Bacteroidales bacterium]HQP04347.1 aminopeptidase P family protein [Bacteroidales bacterium]
MNRYSPIPADLFVRNRKKLYGKICSPAIILLFSSEKKLRSGDQYYKYRQNSDLFYLSGIEQDDTVLVLCPSHPNTALHETVFVPAPDERNRIWYGDYMSQNEITDISGITNVKLLPELESYIGELLKFSSRIYVPYGVNENGAVIHSSCDNVMASKICHHFNDCWFGSLNPILSDLRLVKEPEELMLIQKAISITSEAFQQALKTICPGKYEYEIEAAITSEFIRSGASDHAFPPIVASGSNACILHYNKNSGVLQEGDLVLLDFGAEYANYSADCSRTAPVNGYFSERQKSLYNAVLSVSRQITSYVVPGNTILKLNEIAGELMQEELLKLGLISVADVAVQSPENAAYKKYFMHGVSHFMGLDVHDVGAKSDVFRKGMVLTCEPGIYIAKEGIGVRIENDILVGDEPVNLMDGIPIVTEEIEDLMRQNIGK